MSNRYVLYLLHEYFHVHVFELILAICDPACENGETCTAPNTCECLEKISGNQCSLGMFLHHEYVHVHYVM